MAYSVNAVRAILTDVQRYLSEVLSEENLSTSAEEDRLSLLDKISVYVPDRKPSISPTPYLDMNGINKKKADLPAAVKEEYVNSDKKEEVEWYEEFPVQQQQQQQLKSPQPPPLPPANSEPVTDPEVSVALCKATAIKFGPLKRKEKRFFFGHLHRYWVGLTGNKLLVFNGETDLKPSFVLDVRGYQARPVFSSPTKDTKKKDACFEIVCPGNKTFQFIARTPKDMEQWVSAICVAALSGNKIEEELEVYDDVVGVNGAHEEEEEIYHDIEDVQRDDEVELRLPPRKPVPLPKDYSADRDSIYDDVGFGHPENTYYNVIQNSQGNPEKNDNNNKESQEGEQEEIYDDIGTHRDSKEMQQLNNEGGSTSRIQLLIQQMEASFSNGKKPMHNIPLRTHSLASSASSEILYEPMETAEDQSDEVLSPVAPQLPPRTHFIRT